MTKRDTSANKKQRPTNESAPQEASSSVPVAATEAASTDTTVDETATVETTDNGGETPELTDTTVNELADETIEILGGSDEQTGDAGEPEQPEAGDTVAAPAVEGADASKAAEDRKAAISAAKPDKKTKEPATPKFVPDESRRSELLAMSNTDLFNAARSSMKDIEVADSRVFIVDDSNGLVDHIVGSPLERSGIRSTVVAFLRSRVGELAVSSGDDIVEHAAPGWAIAAYMRLANGVSYKGSFDLGYLAARGRDVRRGMVARKQLKFGGELASPTATPAATAEATPAGDNPEAAIEAVVETGAVTEAPVEVEAPTAE